MTVIHPNTGAPIAGMCAYCGRQMDADIAAIYVEGLEAFLHPRCALALGTDLLFDGWVARLRMLAS